MGGDYVIPDCYDDEEPEDPNDMCFGMNEGQCVCALYNYCEELNPNDPENDLPLPCETPEDYSDDDTIMTNNNRVKEAFKYILPPQYAPFIQFDANGNLNTSMLLSAQSASGVPSSNLYNALIACANANFDIGIYVTSSWQGMIGGDTSLHYYSWTTNIDPYNNQVMDGITIIPGPIPQIQGVPSTGNPSVGWVFIKRGEESSNERLASLIVHELLGHMYSFLQGNPYTHDDPQFNSWINAIESEARKNWKLIKKWKQSNQNCF